MKKKIFVYLCALAGMFAACDDMTDQPQADDGIQGGALLETGTAEMYILSEGLFNLNNSTLARYSFSKGTWTPNWFYAMNRRDLGDTANDMDVYGSKLYVVVNVSSTVEVINLADGKVLQQISLVDENGASRQPRAVALCARSTEPWPVLIRQRYKWTH